MANLQINASLNITNTLANIVNDVDKKINPQIQANSKARVKLVGSLDISKTIKTINANLQNINKDLKVQIGNVYFAPINTAQLQNNINQATQNVKPTVEVKPVVDQNSIGQVQQGFKQVIQSIQQASNATTKYQYQNAELFKQLNTPIKLDNSVDILNHLTSIFKSFDSELKITSNDFVSAEGKLSQFTIGVTSANGAVERFVYKLQDLRSEQEKQNGNDPQMGFALSNIQAADAGIQRLIESTQKWKDKTKATRTDMMSDLRQIRKAWEDVNGGKSVKDTENIQNLRKQYVTVVDKIKELRNANTETFSSLKADANQAINKLRSMVSEYHNAEKVATTLRAKDYDTVLSNTGSNIKGFESDINKVQPLVQLMNKDIESLKKNVKDLNESTDRKTIKTSKLTALINELDVAERRFQSFKKLFQDFGKADWYSDNKTQIISLPKEDKIAVYRQYLDSIKKEWKELSKTSGLENISKAFSDLGSRLRGNISENTLNRWVEDFDKLIVKSQEIKNNLDAQATIQKEIYQIQGEINKLSVNPDAHKTELTDLQAKLEAREQDLNKLKTYTNLYNQLLPREQEEAYLLQQTTAEREKLNQIQNQSADKITVQNTANLKAYVSEIDTAITKLQGLSNQPVFGANANNAQIQTTKTYIQSLTTEYEKLKQSLNGNLTADQLTQVKSRLAELDAQLKKAESDVKQLKASFKSDKDAQKLAGDISILTAQIKKFRAQNTRSEGRFGAEYQELLDKLKQRPDVAGLYAIRQEFRKLQGDVRAAGLTGMTFFDTFKRNISKMSSWLGVSSLGMLVGREIRQMFSDVVKLDEALVDLKKTFQGTSQDLQDFYYESNNIARQLGVTTEEVITQASSWSRLGYNTKETAIEMAKLSSEMALISPGLSTEDAQSGLVSIMKAYSVEVDDVTRKILDNINIIGNNFATSNAEIITGLQKSSAAMAAMGSTFEENVSLFTAGQSIIQDASTVGNALRSISLRIRGSIFVASIYRNVYAA